jgi:prepilin signal peptidase PulO-like enzyme (type II secretory pathway)
MHNKLPIGRDRSRCTHCKRQLTAMDLIPVVSYVALRARCRSCHAPIAPSYVVTEVLLGLLFAATFVWRVGADAVLVSSNLFLLLRDWYLFTALAFLFLSDLLYEELPDEVTLPSLVVLAGFSWALGLTWPSLLLGIVVGGGFFLLQYLISGGKWIGGGDIRLGALMGAIFGWPLVLVALFVSYLLGASVAIPLLLSGKKQLGQTIPFGTFLAVGTVLTLWVGPDLLAWYLSLV